MSSRRDEAPFMNRLDSVGVRIDRVLTGDRPALRRRWRRLTTGPEGSDPTKVAQLETDLQQALQRQLDRQQRQPTVHFANNLPIHEHREEIQQALASRQVIVVAGETGSGKSTQLPKICLDAGLGSRGLIGHTQPRRIAARTIAARLADELRVSIGREVGYKIRFQDQTDRNSTFIKLMTDGVLLAETQSDRYFDQYQTIILDEAHERSLNIDFLLGYLKERLTQRQDLKLIITSATIDAERFSEHFLDEIGPAPIIEVSGRTYPVEVRYRPLLDEDGEEVELADGLINSLRELMSEGSGDVLVFLPTEREIREISRHLRRDHWRDGRAVEVLPLYARLSAREQNRIFQPSKVRRIVLATNVAESSLTVPGVRYVVDAGTARISRYAARSKIMRLPVEPISRASADQRAGRCGRVAAGVCIRLYDEQDYEQRDRFTTPEIRRTNLASVILQAKSLQLGEIEDYPFLDPPRPEAIRDGYKTLFEIQAIDVNRRLTEIGRRLARMPVDPRIGRMILAGDEECCLNEVLIVAAALEIQDPRERPYDRQQQADERHERFKDTDSDFLGYLKLWDFFMQSKAGGSRNRLRKICQQNFLSYGRMREWTEIHRQLLEIVKQNRMKVPRRREDFAALHRALLSGLLSNVAYRSSDHEYTGASGTTLHTWPGSGTFRERFAWIMAAERVETSKRYARIVARISPNWIEPLAEHLVKRSYSDPHWSKKKGTVMAYEKVSLMGMPVVARRRIRYTTIDPKVSREKFIQGALVDQHLHSFDRFVRENAKLREEIEDLAAKTRRRDYLIDEYSIYHFYDERLPAEVFDVASMRRWLRADAKNRRRITMEMSDLLAELPAESNELFPNQLQIGNLDLPVEYHFRPGDENDGVTVSVPREAVHQISQEELEWLVPGLFEERLTALIRSLPKRLRRSFVPVPDTVSRISAEIDFGQGDMLEAVARKLSDDAGERVQSKDFQLDKIPLHLIMNIRIVDADGKPQRTGRDLNDLRANLGPVHGDEGVTDKYEPEWQRDGIREWDFEELPMCVPMTRGGIAMEAFPALIDQGDFVNLRLLHHQPQALASNRRGITRLYQLAARKSLRSQVRWLPEWDQICVWASTAISVEDLIDQLMMRVAALAFLSESELPRDKATFEQRLSDRGERIALATQELTPLVRRLFENYHQAELAIESLQSEREQGLRCDVQDQLQHLVGKDLFISTPWQWLQEVPRYLTGICHRIDKWKSGGQRRDLELQQQLAPFWTRYQERRDEHAQRGWYDFELVESRWMIEEMRISLFAQALGTRIKISPQRLEKQWAKVEP